MEVEFVSFLPKSSSHFFVFCFRGERKSRMKKKESRECRSLLATIAVNGLASTNDKIDPFL